MEKVNEIQGNIIMINERTSLNSTQSRNKILKTRCNFSKRVFGGEDRFNARIGSRVNEVQQVRGHWRDTKHVGGGAARRQNGLCSFDPRPPVGKVEKILQSGEDARLPRLINRLF